MLGKNFEGEDTSYVLVSILFFYVKKLWNVILEGKVNYIFCYVFDLFYFIYDFCVVLNFSGVFVRVLVVIV